MRVGPRRVGTSLPDGGIIVNSLPRRVLGYPTGVWNPSVILGAARQSLEERERAIIDEQGVHGLDSLGETMLHPLIEQGLLDSGRGVHREVAYPSSSQFTPKNSARPRCDLVLTEQPDTELFDPIAEQKLIEQASGTLFGEVVHTIQCGRAGAEPGVCYWVEVKAVAQHAYIDGVPMPNRRYARELTKGPMADIAKLASEPAIWHAAMMVILFAESDAVIEHDLTQLVHECLNADLPVGPPEIESLSISDRVGNSRCGIGIIPVRL